MSKIFVCPLSQLDETLKTSGASWMISLSGPGKSPKKPETIRSGYLALEFNDIAEPADGLVAPNEEHISQLFRFIDQWDRRSNLLVHCWMGISRSTAASLIVLAHLNPDQDFEALAQRLRTASPMATPNSLMISIADRLLTLEGRLERAVAAMGRGADAFEGIPFHLETQS